MLRAFRLLLLTLIVFLPRVAAADPPGGDSNPTARSILSDQLSIGGLDRTGEAPPAVTAPDPYSVDMAALETSAGGRPVSVSPRGPKVEPPGQGVKTRDETTAGGPRVTGSIAEPLALALFAAGLFALVVARRRGLRTR
ncbi:MAG: hypothetical protein ACM3JJ_12855 [Hyphomicrobiales bacterium]